MDFLEKTANRPNDGPKPRQSEGQVLGDDRCQGYECFCPGASSCPPAAGLEATRPTPPRLASAACNGFVP
jgi:hypothetical protein